MPKRIDKRVLYFDKQKLNAIDFKTDQAYHINRQRSHNQWLHCSGVCEGLNVSLDIKAGKLITTPGTAIDLQGRQIVLSTTRTKDLEDLPANFKVYISYNQEQSDEAKEEPNDGRNMRLWEVPEIKIVEKDSAPGDHILLADVDLGAGKVDNTVRRYAGLQLPGAGKPDNHATLYSMGPHGAEFSGNLHIAGDLKVNNDLCVDSKVGIGISKPSAALDVKGTINATKYTGDGSQLRVNKNLSIQDALDTKLNKDSLNFKEKEGCAKIGPLIMQWGEEKVGNTHDPVTIGFEEPYSGPNTIPFKVVLL